MKQLDTIIAIALIILLPAGCSMGSRRGGDGVNVSVALDLAIERNDYETAQWAIHKGADLGGTGNGSTPLMRAARAGSLKIVKLIVSERPDRDSVNNDDGEGRTALWWAAQGCHADVVRFLVERGATVNVRDQNNTALMNAAQAGCADTAVALLDRGARVNDRAGFYTALVLAAWYCHTDTARLLIERGARVNQADAEGATPLIRAAITGCEDTVRMLLAKGARTGIRDNEGKTALTHARERKEENIIRLLRGR